MQPRLPPSNVSVVLCADISTLSVVSVVKVLMAVSWHRSSCIPVSNSM
jgi:hypothetical protein